jgi:molecular chaperone GrpE
MGKLPSERPPQSEAEQRPGNPVPSEEQGSEEEAGGGRAGVDSGVEAEAAAGRIDADLDALLADVKRERDEYLELAQRTRADFDNYRKRMAAETKSAAVRGKAELAEELIGVIDDLERALAAAEIDAVAALAGDSAVEGALEQGVLLVYRRLSETLRRAGVEAYDPAGERFDPAWHEALQTRAEEDAEPGTVVEVLQRGYRLNGRVLRAARVVVSE